MPATRPDAGARAGMADKSWGVSVPSSADRPPIDRDGRAAARAQAREARAQERTDATARRLEERAAAREAEVAARERARTARREEEQAAAAADPHAAAARRHRSSGRKDVVREQRDTRGYATVVDHGRMRELAKRGASIAGLAGAFGVSEDEVRAALDQGEPAGAA